MMQSVPSAKYATAKSPPGRMPPGEGIRVKICGLRQVEHALAAAEAGANLIGFIFADARRRVTPEDARRMVDAVRAAHRTSPAAVGIFVNSPAADVNRVARVAGLDYVQLSGDEPPGFEAELELPALRVLRVLREATAEAVLERARRYRAARFTLDAGHTQAYGGTGETLDWQLAAAVASSLPVILAGGLTPENVSQAIRVVRPWGVDVSSGVETDGVKDVAKIKAFVREARAVEGSDLPLPRSGEESGVRAGSAGNLR